MPFVGALFFHLSAGELTSIEKATHVIRGTIDSTETEFAGGLIPITHVVVRVKEVYKNTDGQLATNSVVRLLVYGCRLDAGNIVEFSHKEVLLFKKGQEIIVPLKKNHASYVLFDQDDPFALTYVTNTTAAGYDEDFEKKAFYKEMKDDYFLRQQRQFKNREQDRRERIRVALWADKMMRNSTRNIKDIDIGNARNFRDMIAAKAAYSPINAANAAYTIAKVRIKEIREENVKSGGKCTLIFFECIKNIKGKQFQKEDTISIPSQQKLNDEGWIVPAVGDTGLILLNDFKNAVNSTEFFLKQINGGLQTGRNDHISEQELMEIISKEQ